jgi:Bifunctional DNA primase/polymerase, N-terminal
MGSKDASADPNEIRKMFSPHPGCLIGVPTGSPSGIGILDVDPRHNGQIWYESNKTRLPPTRIHRTRGGGLHRLFRHMDSLRNTTAKIAPGVDTRCEGGYFIWWPATGLEFQDYPPTGLPEWPLWLLPSMMSNPVPPPPPYKRSFIKDRNLSSCFLVAKVSGLAANACQQPGRQPQ